MPNNLNALTVTTRDAHRPTPLHLRIFVASPGDVSAERALAREVIQNLQYDPGLTGRITVEVVAWDHPGTNTPMLATYTPQAAIAKGLPRPSECDIVVTIFWSRLGTPLPTNDPEWIKPDGSAYASGTEWEYLDAVAGHKANGSPDVLIYRRSEEVLLSPKDPRFKEKLAQYEKVEAFFASFTNAEGAILGGVNSYATPDDFRQRLDAHLKKLAHDRLKIPHAQQSSAALSTSARPADLPLWQGSPFPGLRAFTPDDAPIYFGRGRETDELIRTLADPTRRLVMVIGASGSGKSSLVAAGLLPRLHANAIVGSKDWLLPATSSHANSDRKTWLGLRFTPGELGDNPFLALAAKLAPMLPGDALPVPKLADELTAHPTALPQRLRTLLPTGRDWAEVLLFVDQFEELLTTVGTLHQGAFVESLIAAAATPRVRIVATIRADFYHRLIEAHPSLADALRERGASFPLGAPGAGALFEMITGPAARAGLRLDDGLAQRLVDDTGSAPGGLALLAFALHVLYEAKTTDGHLTQATYDGFNGVRGAIARRADDTLAKLPNASDDTLATVFRQLVEVDERGLATRRRAARSLRETSPQATELLNAFIDARLLVSDSAPDGGSVVEVAHEALLREWPRLRDWIAERADDLRLLRQVESAAREWLRDRYNDHHLWPQERLEPVYQALARMGDSREALPEPTISFVRPEVERLLVELERPETTHQRRATIGDRLDQLDDPRPGVGLRADGVPDIVWCDIPGGSVEIAFGVDLDEMKRAVFTVQPFRMAKYPITFRQYKAFTDAPDGYADPRWWGDLKQLSSERGEQYRAQGNHPAENLSWYDAIAFCRWLSSKLGRELRLPTEWEWQQAATSGDASFPVPWGKDVPFYGNSRESRLSRTTAVGIYPAGISKQGVLDLSGNVSEWCLNLFENSEYIAIRNPGTIEDPEVEWMRLRRVVRGGSCWDSFDSALSWSRGCEHPEHFFHYLGFRVVCVSPYFEPLSADSSGHGTAESNHRARGTGMTS